MNTTELFSNLYAASSVADFDEVLEEFCEANQEYLDWMPFGGRENNRGTIEASADPGRSIVERITNGIDAVLEDEYVNHAGIPDPRSPKEAATAWLNIPSGGLSQMTPADRRAIAQRVSIKVKSGEGKSSRIVEVRDAGIGLTPDEMPTTILSLNESNKMQKHYLVGAYGQGGSSTLATSKYVFVASRHGNSLSVGFTIALYQDLPPEEYKIGRYAYLVMNGGVLVAEVPLEDFPAGTLVRHYGYDLTNYSTSLGPASLYGMLNQILFDPVLPIWLDDHEVHNYRRVIKGTRNALNGAIDEGDDERRGSNLAHHMAMFYVTLPDAGRIGIEYWVLEPPTHTNKRPSAAFVNPAKPIVLTLNGQNHAEMPQTVIRKDAELPYLSQRFICHIDCNALAPAAKRALFVSNREDARRGMVYDLIYQELVRVLKSDDDLSRLNSEAREQGMRQKDETATQKLRAEVARLLHLQGINAGMGTAPGVSSEGTDKDAPTRSHHPRRPVKEIEIHEPPTYIKIVWDEAADIEFFPGQRRYIRIETDANSSYHNANDPLASRINIVTSAGLSLHGSTPLAGGRMRVIIESDVDINIGATGKIRVELSRLGLPVLTDEHQFQIVAPPPARQDQQHVTLPPFLPVPVYGPDDQQWTDLSWPDDVSLIASSAQMDNSTLYIYYSTVYPKYAEQLAGFERADAVKASFFTSRYEVWIAVHSLLLYYDQQRSRADTRKVQQEDVDVVDEREREERRRLAAIAVLVAANEVRNMQLVGDADTE